MIKIPDNVLVVFDEAYAEICLGKMPKTIPYRLSRPVITLRTFSKSYGLAGLRIGYGIAHKSIVTELEKLRQPFNVNLLAQNAALMALDDIDYIVRCRKVYQQAKEYFEQKLTQLGYEYQSSYSNFILIKFDDAQKVYHYLEKNGIITRPMGGYNLANYLRVTYSTLSDNECFFRILEKI